MIVPHLLPREFAFAEPAHAREWQWAEVQWDTEEDLEKEAERKKAGPDEDDIYAADGDFPPSLKTDWLGIDRDRRSAYLMIGVLKQEGLL